LRWAAGGFGSRDCEPQTVGAGKQAGARKDDADRQAEADESADTEQTMPFSVEHQHDPAQWIGHSDLISRLDRCGTEVVCIDTDRDCPMHHVDKDLHAVRTVHLAVEDGVDSTQRTSFDDDRVALLESRRSRT
jgi:hypothetical protein